MLATAYWATSAQGGVTRQGVVLPLPSVACYRRSIKPTDSEEVVVGDTAHEPLDAEY